MGKNIDYSDGDVEKRIEGILAGATDLRASTNIAAEHYEDWPVRYHLSKIRPNCIRHLNFSGLDVLEFGAGMGAMSRYVAEHAAHLTVVEGTAQRYQNLSLRLRDLKNWDGVIANYQDYKTDRKYDVVCFFGVLEYAGLYIRDDQPFDWALRHARSFLKEGGVLLIVIENKNGMKYWAGIGEDHYGKPFYGVCGYPETPGIKTFSRKEMTEMLNAAGFAQVDVQHLAPDYKMTRAVLTDAFVREHPDVAAAILGGYGAEDYAVPTRKPAFNEALAFNSVARSGLLGEFSNSHLFIAGAAHAPARDALLSRNILGAVWTDGRLDDVATVFKNENGKVVARKSNGHISSLHEGESLSLRLLSLAYYGKRDEFLAEVEAYIAFVFARFAAGNGDANVLMPKAFDAIPRNAVVKRAQEAGDAYALFDLEYDFGEITKSYFLFRFAMYTLETSGLLSKVGFPNRRAFYAFLCASWAVAENTTQAIAQEAELASKIFSKPVSVASVTAHFDPPPRRFSLRRWVEKKVSRRVVRRPIVF